MTSKKHVKDELQEIIEQECKKHIVDVRKNLKGALEAATLSLVGIQKDYHKGYSVDHCNGRNSVLIDAFREIAIQEARKIAENYKPSTEDVVHYAKAFEKEFSSQIQRCIRELAREKAKEEAQKIVDSIQLDVNKFLSIED